MLELTAHLLDYHFGIGDLSSEHLFPDIEVNGALDKLDIKDLSDRGVRACALDIDLTLCPYGGREIDVAVLDAFNSLRNEFPVYFVSDGDGERVREFADKYNVPVVSSRFNKSSLQYYDDVKRTLRTEYRRIAFISDILLPDIVRANKRGIVTVKVEPPGSWREPFEIRAVRWVGDSFLRYYKKSNSDRRV